MKVVSQFPFLSTEKSLVVLRISLGLMLAAHGVIRIYAGTVGDFGEFLNNSGFPFGTFIAWGITSFEIIGGATLALGHFHKLICLGFIIQLLMGIFLVHLANGWFVVGYSSGGVEYSVLLIICFFVIASTAAEK